MDAPARGGVTPAAFVERTQRLPSGEPAQGPTGTESPAARVLAARSNGKPVFTSWRSKPALLATITVVVVLALSYLVANRLVFSKRDAEVGVVPRSAAQSTAATTFNPPPHSIAVLPFVNMSGDKEQEYFSDGLTEELLNSLSAINELQVAARTSAFSFKGKDTDIGTIARKLNVGAVLEGSVRRSAHTIRITAQLINAVTGFHLWSKTYDRDLGDVLKLQTEIATAVASALQSDSARRCGDENRVRRHAQSCRLRCVPARPEGPPCTTRCRRFTNRNRGLHRGDRARSQLCARVRQPFARKH